MALNSTTARVAPEILQVNRKPVSRRRKPLRRLALLCSLLGFLLGACASPTTPVPTPSPAPAVRLTVVTAGSGQTLLTDWIAGYEATHRGLVLTVRPATLRGAQGDLAQGKADLALLDQEPAPFYRGVLTPTHVADEPVAVVVNPANPLRNLSAAVLAEVFSGRVADWSEVGGMPGPVQVYVLPDSAGVVQALTRAAMAERSLAPQAIVSASPEALQRAVAASPSGIGFLPAGSLSSEVIVLQVDGSLPGETGYPWRMPLFLVHGKTSPPQALEFVRFVRRSTK